MNRRQKKIRVLVCSILRNGFTCITTEEAASVWIREKEKECQWKWEFRGRRRGMYRILVVDDEQMIADGLKFLIEKGTQDCEVVGVAYDGRKELPVL